ncbi:MAG: helix-turn-helix domain-containing protein [Nanoarchaeota archaeon]
MWTVKFKVFDENNVLNKILRKNKVKIYYYPINYYIKENRYYFIATGIIQGNKKNISNYFKELKSLKNAKEGRRVDLLEIEGNFFTLISSHTINTENRLFVNVAYNPSLIHYKPVVWHEDGWEEFNVASMERKDIEKLVKIGETKYKLKLLEFKQNKIKNLGYLTILPELTDKQKKAIELAIRSGYYEYPRKIHLEKLAKLSNLALSTYQAHLRKAERKLLPYIVSKS